MPDRHFLNLFGAVFHLTYSFAFGSMSKQFYLRIFLGLHFHVISFARFSFRGELLLIRRCSSFCSLASFV